MLTDETARIIAKNAMARLDALTGSGSDSSLSRDIQRQAVDAAVVVLQEYERLMKTHNRDG